MSDKYSKKDFTGWDLTANKDMSGLTIEGSCFSHETPDSIVFPEEMTGTIFIDCNLDNCIIPDGNKVIGGSQRRFKVQNDLNDWVVGEDDKPTAIIDHAIFEKYGKTPPRPEDIPAEKVDTKIDWLAAEEKEDSELKLWP